MRAIGRLVLAAVAIIALSPGTTSASTGQVCDLHLIGFNADSTGTNIYLSCNQDTHVYVAYTTTGGGNPGCGTVSMDALKLFHSSLVSSRLSGRTATVWWNTCTGSTNTRAIASVDF